MLDLSKISKDEEIQSTLFANLCESGKFFPHVYPEESVAVDSPCAGRNRLNIVTCQDHGIADELEDVGGLNMMDVGLHIAGEGLPDFIPIIPRGMFKCPGHDIPSQTVGIVFNDILTSRTFYKCGYLRIPEKLKLNETVLSNQAFRGKRVILFSTGPDILIETLWWQRDQKNIFKTIAGMGFAAVTGMNFSIFKGECPFGHALNIKKSLRYCEELDKLGIWAIPHTYAVNRYQRERWKNWLLANSSVRFVTINCQLQRRQRRGMSDVSRTVLYLLENTPVEIVIQGSPNGLKHLIKKFGKRLHFAASGPLKNALIRKGKTAAEYINMFRESIRNHTLS
jgi:hypothetical protein